MNSSLKVLLQLSAIFVLSAQLLSVSAVATVSKSTTTLHKRGNHHIIEPRQEGGKEKADGAAKASSGGKAVEEAAGQLVGMLLQMGEALDAVTNMGSNATIVKLGSDVVTKILPDAQKARVTVMNSVARTEKLNALMKQSDVAGEQILQLLKTISENPEDANVIKKNFPALGKAFGEVFTAAEGAVTAAFPDKAGQISGAKKLNVQPEASTESTKKTTDDKKPEEKKKTKK